MTVDSPDFIGSKIHAHRDLSWDCGIGRDVHEAHLCLFFDDFGIGVELFLHWSGSRLFDRLDLSFFVKNRRVKVRVCEWECEGRVRRRQAVFSDHLVNPRRPLRWNTYQLCNQTAFCFSLSSRPCKREFGAAHCVNSPSRTIYILRIPVAAEARVQHHLVLRRRPLALSENRQSRSTLDGAKYSESVIRRPLLTISFSCSQQDGLSSRRHGVPAHSASPQHQRRWQGEDHVCPHLHPGYRTSFLKHLLQEGRGGHEEACRRVLC